VLPAVFEVNHTMLAATVNGTGKRGRRRHGRLWERTMSTMSAEPPIESHCARCLRQAPDLKNDRNLDALEWEPLVNADGDVLGVICPDCITPEEQQAMDEDDMALLDVIDSLAAQCARRLKDVPYESDDPGEPLPPGWIVLDSDVDAVLVVCPDCVTPEDQ
jgi:hypothetical protein